MRTKSSLLKLWTTQRLTIPTLSDNISRLTQLKVKYDYQKTTRAPAAKKGNHYGFEEPSTKKENERDHRTNNLRFVKKKLHTTKNPHRRATHNNQAREEGQIWSAQRYNSCCIMESAYYWNRLMWMEDDKHPGTRLKRTITLKRTTSASAR